MDIEDLLKGGQPSGAAADGKTPRSPLHSLKSDLDFYKESIQEISTELMTEGYTLYPIFVAHQHQVDVGEMILDREELNTRWSIQASSLEEFVERGIIKEEKKAHFIKQFKPAKEYMCLFVVVPEGANFVFYPF